MTGKNDFEPEEWQLLSAMPWIAGVLVIVGNLHGSHPQVGGIGEDLTMEREVALAMFERFGQPQVYGTAPDGSGTIPPVDVIVADPARPGLGKPGVAALTAAEAAVFVLVSCDPVSLARDVTLMAAATLAVLLVALFGYLIFDGLDTRRTQSADIEFQSFPPSHNSA